MHPHSTNNETPEPVARIERWRPQLRWGVAALWVWQGLALAQPAQPCDFDGDGMADQFMATGVSWWLRSGVTGQWRFLSTHTEQAGALTVRDMDGDGRCDVVRKGRLARPDQYAPSGTGPWLTVGSITRAPDRLP